MLLAELSNQITKKNGLFTLILKLTSNLDWSPGAQKAREKKIEKKIDVGRRQNIWRQNALKTHKLA